MRTLQEGQESLQPIAAPTDDPEDPARYWSAAGVGMIAEPLLRRLLDYWRGLRRDRGLPPREAIDAVDIAWALDRVYLIDRVAPPVIWRYRLAGVRIEEAFRVNTLRGASLDDIMGPQGARLVKQRWQPLIDRPCVVYMHGTIYRAAERLSVGGRLLLPLGDAGSGAVAGILGVTDGVWQDQARDRPAPGFDIHYVPLDAV